MKRFIITLLVCCSTALLLSAAVPTWSVTPSNYSNSMVMVGVININQTESVDSNDMVAAFINGEVRGVANLQYEAAADRYIAYLLIYSNESSGDITFKVYDADADLEIDVQNTSTFVINGTEGNVGTPIVFSDILLSDEASITTFTFPEVDGSVVFGTGTIDVPVLNSSDLTSLIASFSQSAGSRVTVGGIEQASDVSINDFSAPLTYRITSESGNQFTDYVVTVSKTNHVPTDVLLSASNISENNAVNDLIGNLAASDDDATHTFALVSGTGSEDNGSFLISGSQLLASEVFDFENKSSYSVRIEVTDGANQKFEKSFTISISDVNESPTAMTISASTIGEHTAIGSVIGSLSTTDPDNGDTFTYALSGALADNDFFSIDGSNFVSANAFNFETQNTFSIQVTVTDGGTNTFDQPLTISISDENDAPTALAIDNSSVFENLPFGTVIGNLSISDEDASDVHSFSLVAGTGDTDNASVIISGNQLLTNTSFDFETTPSISVRLIVSDAASSSFEQEFTITILDANDSPTDLLLSNSALAESESIGFVIGAFSVVDTDPTTTTYSFVDGQNDNSGFSITGDNLELAVNVNFESKNEYVIDVLATDIDNQSISNRFTISISDVNEGPTALSISTNSIGEHATIGTIIGALSTADPDDGDTFTYSLSGALEDNDFFSIDGNNLVSISAFNFESQSTFSIQLTTSDGGANTFDQPLTISISDENDAPTALAIDNTSVFENLPFGTVIGNLSISDEDASDVHSFSLVAGTGDTDNASVIISGNQLLTNTSFDFETTPSISVRLIVRDAASANFEQDLNITILDANDSPTDLLLSNSTLAENESIGFAIGAFSVVDTDPTTTTYSFVDGQNDNSVFSISGDNLELAVNVDFESKDQYTIDVLATDIDNQSVSNRFTISVSDVNESPTDMTVSAYTIGEHTAIDSIIGALSTADPDDGDTFTYSLSGALEDNDFFSIDGSNLVSTSAFNFETQNTFSIQITTTDGGANTFDQPLTISLSDENDAPSSLSIDNTSVLENSPFGTVIGNLSTTDEDEMDTHSFTLVAGTGDIDNAAVLISGNQLLANESFDFETTSFIAVRLQVKDALNSAFEQEIRIDVLNENEAPIIITALQSAVKNVGVELSISLADVFTDQDENDSLTISLLVDQGDLLPAGVVFDTLNAVVVVNNEIQLLTFDLNVKATDKGGLMVEQTITVDMEVAPLGISNVNALSIFPNPVGDKINIMQTTSYQLSEAKIYTLSGSLIRTINNITNNQIDVMDLKKGIYVLVVKAGIYVRNVKFIKK